MCPQASEAAGTTSCSSASTATEPCQHSRAISSPSAGSSAINNASNTSVTASAASVVRGSAPATDTAAAHSGLRRRPAVPQQLALAHMASVSRWPAVVAVATLLLLCGLAARPATDNAHFAAPVCDDAAVVDTKQTGQLRGLLEPLVTSPFFATFRVTLDANCPFWNNDNGKCAVRECSVCNCSENEVPVAWRAFDDAAAAAAAREAQATAAELDVVAPKAGEAAATDPETSSTSTSANPNDGDDDQQCESVEKGDTLNDVDRSLAENAGSVYSNWGAPASPTDWTVQEVPGAEMIYVDLRKNPERYTGFSGMETRRVWSAIYDENCFAYSSTCKSGTCEPGTCKEERVLFRLISGVHTSITMHLARYFLHGTRWGPNYDIFKYRVRNFPERITNLHVTLAIVLRALAKAAPSLDPAIYDYSTGNSTVDKATSASVRALLAHPLLARGCEDKVFDESDMFLENPAERLPEFRAAFRNISMIMDCVGCEKCRLWGKLQFLGLGTALSVLFTDDESPVLKRNEAIALFNLLFKLLSSAEWVEELNSHVEQRARLHALLGKVVAGVLVCILALAAKATTTSGISPTKDSKKNARLSDNRMEAGPRGSQERHADIRSDANTDDEDSSHMRRRRRAVAE